MRTIITRALLGALVGSGIAILGAGVANAAETSGDDGLLSGTQALVSVDVPVTISGNGISVIGDSASHRAESTVAPASAPAASTSGSGGAVSGSQALITVSVPVTVSGNAVSVAGDSTTEDASTAVARGESSSGSGGPSTDGDESIVGGSQLDAPVTAPVTVGGNAISVLGDSSTGGSGTGVATGGKGSGSTPATSGRGTILGGTQVQAPVTAPITVSGNAVSGVGDAESAGSDTGVSAGGGPIDPTDPTDPTDPSGPTGPKDPTHPEDAKDPIAAGTARGEASALRGGLASPGLATVQVGGAELAKTGSDIGTAWTALLTALFLLGGGSAILLARHRAA